MKGIRAFLDRRRCKNWACNISYWKYITIWRPVLPVFQSTNASSLISSLNPLQGALKVSSCSSTWFDPHRGWGRRRQWHPTPVLLPGKFHGGGAWWAAVHGVAKSQTRLSDFTFTFHFHALEKEMATHSRIPAWRIPGMAEPVVLLSMGSHGVGHDWSGLAAAAVAAEVEGKCPWQVTVL